MLPIDVVHQDEHLLVLDKPAGLLAVPGRGADKQDCLSARVQQHFPGALVVHRLDMATSGLMIMARSAAVQRAMSALFEARAISKRYVAVVNGCDEEPAPSAEPLDGWHTIDLPIAVDWPNRPLRIIDLDHGQPSLTHWRVVQRDPARRRMRVVLSPVTGRSHQLRVHLLAVGHPILGDTLYAPMPARMASPRLLLHAERLSWVHPATGQTLTLERAAPF